MNQVPLLYKLLHSSMEEKSKDGEMMMWEFKILVGWMMHVHSSNVRIVIQEMEKYGLVKHDRDKGSLKVL